MVFVFGLLKKLLPFISCHSYFRILEFSFQMTKSDVKTSIVVTRMEVLQKGIYNFLSLLWPK